MIINEKLSEMLLQILREPYSNIFPDSGKWWDNNDSGLHEIACKLVEKACAGDVKAVDKIREIVGDAPWEPVTN